MSTAPRRIEYTGPERWTVVADEDGVHVRTPKGDGLEHAEVLRLIDLVAEVTDQMSPGGSIPTPRPPTREELAAWHPDQRDEYAARRASRAVYRELAPTTDTPPF